MFHSWQGANLPEWKPSWDDGILFACDSFTKAARNSGGGRQKELLEERMAVLNCPQTPILLQHSPPPCGRDPPTPSPWLGIS